ncbi:MAG: putative ubiquitin-RnfH superfamily antitoxin RatB of RatAB toxin-antitoxin module [Gammaproteobacteria bacterium]|jgi:putative ubiquitin-RnfH superfamily antitoxin RatB of RatAB toxin-antitoxin module
MINVDIAYATEKYVELISVKVNRGASVMEAIHQSGIMQLYPEADIKIGNIGIYSKICSEDTQLTDGDRIEIYRPLKADPKEARRKRATRQKNQKM